MAVCGVKLLLLLSIIMMQSPMCMLQSAACEQPMCTSEPEYGNMCVLPNTTCEVQWTPTAVSTGTQHLYSLIASNSATIHDFLIQINNTQDKTAVIQSEIAASEAEIANALQNQTDILTQISVTESQIANAAQNQTETLTQIAASQADMSVTQTQIANAAQNQTETLTQMSATQTQIANAAQSQTETLTQMSATQSQIGNAAQSQTETLTQMSVTQSQIANAVQSQTETLSQIAASQAEISVSQTQVVATQNQMASALDHMVNLLENLTITMNKQLDIDNRDYLQIPPLAGVDDCSQIASQGYPLPSGQYDLQNDGDYPTGPYRIMLANTLQDVYCDMDTDGGGWTVFQRRYDGSVDFYQPWNEYEVGFGRSDGEFWLGLQKIHQLTQSGSWVLRVDIEAFDGSTAYALYDSFRVGNAATNYTLSLGTYQGGTAGDSMRGSHDLNNMPFTTYDRDNDVGSGYNCAEDRQGAWWYRDCTWSNLNGRYFGSSSTSNTGMAWYHWTNSWQSLKRSEMKVRRTQ